MPEEVNNAGSSSNKTESAPVAPSSSVVTGDNKSSEVTASKSNVGKIWSNEKST